MALGNRRRRVHFVGIGGIGMSGLAELLLKLGHHVSGTDAGSAEVLKRLENLGAAVHLGHDAKFAEIQRPDVLVYSSAVRSDNPERLWAARARVPQIRRAEMLAEMMRLKRGIAIAGSHGKTTTTGLVGLILRNAGMDPTIVIGGRLDFLGSNAAWGEGSWLVAEADESDASFLQLSPELAVVTNIDPEHLDHYGSFDSLKKSFGDFLDRLPFYGRSVLCSDNDVLSALVTDLTKPYWTYGMSALPRPHFLIQNLRTNPQGSTFDVWFEGKLWIQLTIGVPGQHNVLNATAAAIVAREIGLSSDEITQGLKLFKGVQRRFEYKGRLGNHAVIEDYAHHPTEIRATLDAAKQAFPNEDLIVAYQPHRYSRTKDQWSEFSTCFVGARQVFTLPIYAASELKPEDVDQWDGESFAKNIQGVHAKACRDFADLATRLRGACETASPLAPILVLGAGDIPKVIPLLLDSKSS